MISNHASYQLGLERIDNLRREAEAWRSVKPARAESDPSPSTTWAEQPLQPDHDQAAHALAA
jgi:hypothetical protein